jgi:hypothetical protein
MNDTPPDVAAAFTALLMRRPEGERAMMAFEVFGLARSLMTADIRARHPGISEAELRVQIFERTYGSEFDECDRVRIADRIRDRAAGRDAAGSCTEIMTADDLKEQRRRG